MRPPLRELLDAVADLQGIAVLDVQADEHARLTGRVADAIDQVAGLMRMPIDLLTPGSLLRPDANWRRK